MNLLHCAFVQYCLWACLLLPWPALGASGEAPAPGAPIQLTPSVSLSLPPFGDDASQSIFFPPDVSLVGDEEVDKLRACVEELKQSRRRSILLVAYSDDLGSRSYNIAIAEQRLAAVSAALRSLGVERGQIRRHRSNSVKIATFACRSETCRQRLRRVDFSCKA